MNIPTDILAKAGQLSLLGILSIIVIGILSQIIDPIYFDFNKSVMDLGPLGYWIIAFFSILGLRIRGISKKAEPEATPRPTDQGVLADLARSTTEKQKSS